MANMIPENVINDIRESVNIVDVISPIVQLQRQGRNFFGKCPFHEEKTASFSVNQEKQIFHCFSCGRGGNVYKFFMDLDGDSFPQAVAKVADIAGKPLDNKYKSEKKAIYNPEQLLLIDLHHQAMRLYHHILINTDFGKDALDYLLNVRKITLDQIEKYQIGFAAPEQKLIDFFNDKNLDKTLLKKSELFIENDQQELHDRFLNRIVFPILDIDDNVVGFSGRSLVDKKIKYMNSPESAIFNKSQLLFNLNFAKNKVREEKKIILVEGFMDVIALSSVGIDNAVASMGTSLTNQQIQMVSKVSDTITIAYDGDQAGMDATNRAIQLISSNSKMKIEIMVLPDNLDPDEYRLQKGNQALMEALRNSRGLTPGSFALIYLKLNKNLNDELDRIDYIKKALEQIKILDEPIEQDIHLQQIAEEFNLDKASLLKQLDSVQINHLNDKKISLEDQNLTSIIPLTKTITGAERAEQLLLSALIDYPQSWDVLKNHPEFSFKHTDYQSIYYLLEDYKNGHQMIKIADFLNQITNDRHYRLLVSIDEIDKPDYQPNQISESIEGYVKTIEASGLNQQIETINKRLKQIGQFDNQSELKKLNQELIDLKRKKEKMESA